MNLDLATELCKRFEGLHRVGPDGMIHPYICPAGVPTQGYGTVYRPDGRKVSMDDPPITRETALQWLVSELLHTYAPGALRQCPGLLPMALATGDWRDQRPGLGGREGAAHALDPRRRPGAARPGAPPSGRGGAAALGTVVVGYRRGVAQAPL